ncbi:unnamed protein product [Rotaria magnacalcarata]
MIDLITKEQMLLYCPDSNESENKWICTLCSSKLKRKQMPSRGIMNNLQVSETPAELKKFNDLEKHLIALRLPFMKIVNLVSGKVSHKFAQKEHPGYKNIQIEDIDEDYLISEKEQPDEENENNNTATIDSEEISCKKLCTSVETTNDDHKNRLALGDIEDCPNDSEEMNEDIDDIRANYNIGTDSCIQSADFSDFVMQENNLHAVAPAEKNKLSALLSDNTIEALAFPHPFPDGRGSFDEQRLSKLGWKEYCKTLNAGQSSDDSQMKFLLGKDMIYRHFQSVRGSPQYWKQRLKDFFAMTRQLGCPTFFARLLRTNPVLTARIFERRFNNLMKLFIKGGSYSLGPVND